jgi:hypothetical protein
MPRRRTRPNALAFPGLFALVAGAAALGFSSGPGTAGFDPTPRHPAGDTASPAFSRGGSSPAPEALRPEHLTPTGVKVRPAPPGIALPADGAPKSRPPTWLCPSGARRTPFSRPPLQILFCTWLA